MELFQLTSFFHTVQLGSISKAAELVCRTQSAVSQQIKSLEGELGCKLFDRVGKRKLVVTDEGKRLYEFATKLIEEIDSTLEDIHTISGGHQGQISIAAPFTTCFQIFPAVLKRFKAQFPMVIVSVYDRSQEKAINMVRNGEADFAITLESVIPNGFHSIAWKRVIPVLIVPTGHSLLKCQTITISDIAQHELIMPPHRMMHPCRSIIEKSALSAGLNLKVVLESSNVELSSRYVEKGLGISFASIVEDINLPKGREIQFIPIDNLLQSANISISMRSKVSLKGARANFVKTMLKI